MRTFRYIVFSFLGLLAVTRGLAQVTISVVNQSVSLTPLSAVAGGTVLTTAAGTLTATGGGVGFTDATTLADPSVVLASPATGYRFDHWSGTLAEGNPTATTISVATAGTLVAHFVQTHVVRVLAALGGTTNAPGNLTVDRNSTYAVTAAPNAGYTLVGWATDLSDLTAQASNALTLVTGTGRGTVLSNILTQPNSTPNPSNNLSFVVTADVTLTPTFSPQGAPAYSLTATPAVGYQFAGWTGTGVTFLDAASTSTVAYGWGTVSAVGNFTPLLFPITVNVSGGGTTDQTGTQQVPYDATFTVTAAGAGFFGWSGTIPNNNAFVRDLSNSLAVATTAGGTTIPSPGVLNQFYTPATLTFVVTGPATVTAGFGQPAYGLTAIPAQGYAFQKWLTSSNATTSSTSNPNLLITGAGALQATALFGPESYAYTVTVVTTGTGAGSVTPLVGSVRTATVTTPAASINLTALPAPGSIFLGWTSPQWVGSKLANPLSYTPTANTAITATFADGTFLVTQDIVQENVVGARSTVASTAVTLAARQSYAMPDVTAQAPLGYRFSHWECSSPTLMTKDSGGQVSVSVQQNLTISAIFKPEVTLTVTQVGSGVTSLSRTASTSIHALGEVLQVTVEPSSDAIFDKWSGIDKGLLSPLGGTLYQITLSKTTVDVTANFRPKARLTVTTANGSTNLPINPVFNPNQMVTFTVTPDQPYVFTSWSGPDANLLIGSGTTVSILMDQDRAITANFSRMQHQVTLGATAGGVVSSSGLYDFGLRLPITATPNPGFAFIQWTGTGTSALENPFAATTVATVVGDLDLTATFAPIRAATLQVCIQPLEVANSTFWRAVGPTTTTWKAACDTATGLPPGDYVLQFSTVPGFTAPLLTVTLGGEDNAVRTAQFYSSLSTTNQVALDRLKLTAVPNAGFEFQNWTGRSAGDLIPVAAPAPNSAATLLMNGPKDINANFYGKTYTITLKLSDTRTNLPIPGITPVVLTVPANSFYTLAGPYSGWAGPSLPLNAPYSLVYGGFNRVYAGPDAGSVVNGGSSFIGLAFSESIYMNGNKEIWSPYNPLYRVNVTFDPVNSGTAGFHLQEGIGYILFDGTPQILYNANLNSAALPAVGYVFESWDGPSVDKVAFRYSNTTNIGPITSDMDLTIHMVATNYTLTVNADQGTVAQTVTSHPAGANITVTPPTALPGYTFAYWSTETNNNAGTNPNLGLNMSANRVITAHYLPYYSLTINTNPALVAGVKVNGVAYETVLKLPQNASVNVVAAPSAIGYQFANWTGSLTTLQSPNSNDTLLTMDGDKTITANYTAKSYTLTVNTENGLLPTQSVTLPVGTTVYLNAVAGTSQYNQGNYNFYIPPAANQTIYYWDGTDVGSLQKRDVDNSISDGRLTVPNPQVVLTGDLTVTAHFVQAYQVSVGSVGGGSVSFVIKDPPRAAVVSQIYTLTDTLGNAYSRIVYDNQPFTVPAGATVEVIPYFQPGYSFASWSGLPPTNPYTTDAGQLIVVNADLNLIATFKEVTDLINPPPGVTGPDNLLSRAVLWYRTEELPDAVDGTAVDTWSDVSGNNRTAIQPNPSLQPHLFVQPALNYRKVLRFDGLNGTMSFPNISTLRTVFIVNTSTATGARNILGHTTSKEIYAGLAWQTGVNLFGGATYNPVGPSIVGVEAKAGVRTGLATRDFDDYSFVSTGAPIVMPVLTGGHFYSLMSSANLQANQITGQVGNGLNWQGDYAEILGFNRELTEGEFEFVRAYLYSKYFLKHTLYQTHSYGGTTTNYGYPSNYRTADADFSSQANGRKLPISATAAAGFDFAYWAGDSVAAIANTAVADTFVTIAAEPTHVHAHFHEKPADTTVLARGFSDAATLDFLNQTLQLTYYGVNLEYSSRVTDVQPLARLWPAQFSAVVAKTAGTYTGAGAVRASYLNVTLDRTAVAAAGMRFVRWSGPSAALIPEAQLAAQTVTIPLDSGVPIVLYADFISLAGGTASYTVTVSSAGNGTVTPLTPTTVTVGTNVDVTASPDAGYTFAYWSGSLASQLTSYLSANASLLVTLNGTLTANFSKTQTALSVTYSPGGTTTPAGVNLFDLGSTQVVTATALPGYHFAYWTGDIGSNVATTPSLSLLLDAAKSVKAFFIKDYIISDIFGITVKLPAQTWVDAQTNLSPAVMGGNAKPQLGMAVSTGDYDVLPRWLQLFSIDGTPTVDWRTDYWTHLGAPTDLANATATQRAPMPYLELTANTVPLEVSRITFPVIEVSDDPVILDANAPGLFYIPGAATPSELAANQYNVLKEVSGLPSPVDVDGVEGVLYQTGNIPGLDQIVGNEELYRLTMEKPATAGDVTNTTAATAGLGVFPAAARSYLSMDAQATSISFNPPPNYAQNVRVTYYVTESRTTGQLDPEGNRRQSSKLFYKDDGTSELRPACWKSNGANDGYTTCWGQLLLKPAGTTITRLPDPMELGATVRASASRSNADFVALYNAYINDIYPGGEKVSGLSAHYILRTIACYFIPGTISKATVAYGCEGSANVFDATAASNLCNNPQANGYQRCIDGFCDWYAYVPGHVACQPTLLTASNWDATAGAADNSGSNFVSLVGTQVNVDNVLTGAQTCVKLPCPKRTATCTP